MADEGYPRGLSVEARRCQTADHGTVDCAQFCRCDDGCDYAIKNCESNPTLPHQEWFCTRLGEDVGLASPQAKIVRVDGVECFGSRWESGNETGNGPENFWWPRVKSGEIDFDLISPNISIIYAFDLFIHNIDRHLTNYIIRKQHVGHSVLSFDYSQAWLFNGFPLPPLPLGGQTKTMMAMRALRQLFGEFLSQDEVQHVCARLKIVPTERIKNIIVEHPATWLTDAQKNAILTWWNSPERAERIDKVEEGIADGSLL